MTEYQNWVAWLATLLCVLISISMYHGGDNNAKNSNVGYCGIQSDITCPVLSASLRSEFIIFVLMAHPAVCVVFVIFWGKKCDRECNFG
jgi:hypothetical protein